MFSEWQKPVVSPTEPGRQRLRSRLEVVGTHGKGHYRFAWLLLGIGECFRRLFLAGTQAFFRGDAGWDGGEWGLPELWKVLQRLMLLVKVIPVLNMNTWAELCIVMNDAMEFEG